MGTFWENCSKVHWTFELYDNGNLVETGGFLGGEGQQAGEEALQQSTPATTDPTLVIVAAMPYAVNVERQGFSVLDGARLQAKDTITNQLRQATL